MLITVDDESHFVLKSNPATLGDVLIEVTEHIQSKNRAIQAILLDGKNIPPEELTPGFGKTRVSEVQTLEVHSAGLAELVASALEEIAEVLPELPVACHELAQILVGDDPASCFGHFNQFLDIWDVIKERQTQVVNLLNVDIDTLAVGGVAVSEHNARLNDRIQLARKYMESSDFPDLSDLLSHDLAEMAEVEEGIIELLKAKL